MASPTKHDAPHAGSMKPTPGVGGAPASRGGHDADGGACCADARDQGRRAEAMVEGIDPVLLHPDCSQRQTAPPMWRAWHSRRASRPGSRARHWSRRSRSRSGSRATRQWRPR